MLEGTDTVGRFEFRPLEPGYGTTIGNALRRILSEPKNALTKQYQELFKMDGVALEFDKGALDAIVDTAVAYKLGARGLRSIMENVMTDFMFDLPAMKQGSKLRITKKTVLDKINQSNINNSLK